LKRVGLLTLLVFVAASLASAAQVAGSPFAVQSHTLLVVPFENASKAPGLDWIGEAFAEILGQRMSSPSLYTVSREDRVYAFERAGVPENLRPSRATLFRIGEEMDADYIVMGSYTFDGQTFAGTAQILDVKRLHLSKEIKEAGPLNNILEIQDSLAWDLLRTINPAYPVSRSQFVAGSPSIRLDAFEKYIRGMTAATRPEKIANLREAVRISPDYTMAIMQLGRTYFDAHDYGNAASWFSKVPRTDNAAREASFYAGLSYYYAAQYDRAENAFSFLAEQFPLTEVYNNLGVVEARRGRKSAQQYFQKAVDADPRDPDYRFNLALSLLRAGDENGATRELEQALKLRPSDAETESLLDQISDPDTGLSKQFFERIKRNYDESSFRQLVMEIQNATELRLANTDPKTHAAYHLEHARDLLSHGFSADAAPELREAVQLDPSNAAAHSALAQALENTSDFAGARAEARKALSIKPSADAYLVLGRLDLRDNKIESATESVDLALGLEPNNEAGLKLKQAIAAKLAERTQPLPKQ
jgi:Flp pilus assembly protein TadD/TolB-like protein